jgi:hypothetical protein
MRHMVIIANPGEDGYEFGNGEKTDDEYANH